MGALATAVKSGRALYAGISSYSPAKTIEAAAILKDLGVPLLIHQPSYSMINRWTERGEPNLYEALDTVGAGSIAFTPLAQGVLTSRYLGGIPAGSRAALDGSLSRSHLSDENLERVRQLNEIAGSRGQSLAQMAIAWVLRDQKNTSPVTSALLGASSVAQLDENLGALENLAFTDAELASIDEFAVDSGVNLWQEQSEL
jgi:L-glyceraldehyde 3-phosphate reductase